MRELVREEMCGAYDLDPPLDVDVGTGEDWTEAKRKTVAVRPRSHSGRRSRPRRFSPPGGAGRRADPPKKAPLCRPPARSRSASPPAVRPACGGLDGATPTAAPPAVRPACGGPYASNRRRGARPGSARPRRRSRSRFSGLAKPWPSSGKSMYSWSMPFSRERRDDLLALGLLHPRVVGALGDQQRDPDVVDPRTAASAPRGSRRLGLRVADARVELGRSSAPSTAGSTRSASSGSTGPTMSTAQRNTSGVNVAPDERRVAAVGAAVDRRPASGRPSPARRAHSTASSRSSCILPPHSRSPALRNALP